MAAGNISITPLKNEICKESWPFWDIPWMPASRNDFSDSLSNVSNECIRSVLASCYHSGAALVNTVANDGRRQNMNKAIEK